MNYHKTIKRLAKQRGYTLKEFNSIANIGEKTRVVAITERSLPKLLSSLKMSQEAFFLELLRDSNMPDDFKIQLEKLKRKYLNQS